MVRHHINVDGYIDVVSDVHVADAHVRRAEWTGRGRRRYSGTGVWGGLLGHWWKVPRWRPTSARMASM